MTEADIRRIVREELAALLGANAGDVMDAQSASEFLGISLNAIYEYAGRGDIPHRRLGRRFLFSRSGLLRWLAPDV